MTQPTITDLAAALDDEHMTVLSPHIARDCRGTARLLSPLRCLAGGQGPYELAPKWQADRCVIPSCSLRWAEPTPVPVAKRNARYREWLYRSTLRPICADRCTLTDAHFAGICKAYWKRVSVPIESQVKQPAPRTRGYGPREL